jgi:hypothetical protein
MLLIDSIFIQDIRKIAGYLKKFDNPLPHGTTMAFHGTSGAPSCAVHPNGQLGIVVLIRRGLNGFPITGSSQRFSILVGG